MTSDNAAIELFVRLDANRLKGLRRCETFHGVLVFLALARYAQNGRGWPSLATLAKDLGLHPRAVRRAIKEVLEPAGCIVADGVGPAGTVVRVLKWEGEGRTTPRAKSARGANSAHGRTLPGGEGLSPPGGEGRTTPPEEIREERIEERQDTSAAEAQPNQPANVAPIKPEPLELIPPDTKTGAPEGSEAVFLEWQRVTGRHRDSFTPKRRECVAFGIRLKGLADALNTVRGLLHSPDGFHMGKAPPAAYAKTGGKPRAYNDLTLIFRDEDKIEQFLGYWREAKAPSTPASAAAVTARRADVPTDGQARQDAGGWAHDCWELRAPRGDREAPYQHDGKPPTAEEAAHQRLPAGLLPIGSGAVDGVDDRWWVWARSPVADGMTLAWGDYVAHRHAVRRMVAKHPSTGRLGKQILDEKRKAFDDAVARALAQTEAA